MNVSQTTLVGIARTVLILATAGMVLTGKLSLGYATAFLAFFMPLIGNLGFAAAKDASAPDARTVTETRQVGDKLKTVTTSEVSEDAK